MGADQVFAIERSSLTVTGFEAGEPAVSGRARPQHARPKLMWLLYFGLPILLAALLRAYQLSRPGYLFGVTNWDDGAYLGQTFRLLDGVIPYRDYTIVEPPGLTLLLAPVVGALRFLGSDGVLAATRVLTNAVDVANVVLIGLVLRHRGRAARSVAMFALAIYPPALAADVSLFLEPYLNFFCLLSLLLMFRQGRFASGRRMFFAGTCLGLAGTIKIFAIFPFLGLVLMLARRDRRALTAVTAGAAAGFGVLCAPFAALAPTAFVRDVLYVQVFRSTPGRTGIGPRLASMAGLQWLHVSDGVALVVGGAALTVVGVYLFRRRRDLQPLEAYCLVTALLVTGALLFTANYIDHYGAFFGPFLIVTAAGVLPPPSSSRLGRIGRCSLVLFAGFVLLSELSVVSTSPPVLAQARALHLPAGACVLTDSPSDLLAADRFETTPGCPVFVDTFGATMAMAHAQDPATVKKEDDTQVVTRWEQLFGRADYVVWTDFHVVDMPATPAFTRWLRSTFTPVGPLPGGFGYLYRHR